MENDVKVESKIEKIRAKVTKNHARDQKELAKWQKQKARPKVKGYFWYLVLLLTLVYITDEVATNLNSTMQSYMVEDFFVNGLGLSNNDALAKWQAFGIIGMVAQVLTIMYRPLADKYGRKVFLVINTFVLTIGMFICFYSPNFSIYLIGFIFLTFMTGPDMQVVYLTEIAPKAHRATFVSVVKGIAQLGIALIALGMDAFMKGNDSLWRTVFLIPAIFGFVTSFLVLIFARETDQFMDERIAYLTKTDEEKIAILSDKVQKEVHSQGGVIHTAKFGFKHYQLKWLFIASMLYTTAFYATSYYGPIITYSGYSAEMLAKTAIVWPFICSAITIAYGFLSDKLGRKKVSTILGSLALIGLALLSFGLYFKWNEYLVGVFLGLFLAGYWNWGDTLILMVSESAPTNLRSSASGDQGMFAAFGYLIGYIVSIIYTKTGGNLAYLDFVFLICAIPGIISAVLIVAIKAKETKGVDLDIVKGDEWDKKKDENEIH